MKASEQKEVLDYLLLLKLEEKEGEYERHLHMWGNACHSQLNTLLPGTPPVRKGTRNYPALKDSHDLVLEFMAKTGFDSLTVPERQVLYNTFATLLVSRAKHLSTKTTAPLTMKLVLQTTTDLPGIFDSAFPGYLQAGLARKVLGTMTSITIPTRNQRS